MHVYIHEINNYHNYYNISIYTAISCVCMKQSLAHPEFSFGLSVKVQVGGDAGFSLCGG